MKLFRYLVASIAVAGLIGAMVPAFAVAQQQYGCNTNTYPYNTNCAPGTLQVYVSVSNNQYTGMTRQPSDFAVTVNGYNPSPTSFSGSNSGTNVSVGGSYSVVASQIPGYVATYSSGCTGFLGGSEHAQCNITEVPANPSYSYPQQPYPQNPYFYPALTCTPQNQTISIGQPVTFHAQGGAFSQYNWKTWDSKYSYNIGQTLTVTPQQAGTLSVEVKNGDQTAICTVNVIGNLGVYPGYPYQYPSPVTVVPTYIPRLPNTGFEPLGASAVAFAIVALIAAAIALLPYVRKAFASILG